MSRFSKIEVICMCICFVAAIILVIYGQFNVGYFGLTLEIIGLALLLFDLYLYNRKYK